MSLSLLGSTCPTTPNRPTVLLGAVARHLVRATVCVRVARDDERAVLAADLVRAPPLGSDT
jgi:hypothetical protein